MIGVLTAIPVVGKLIVFLVGLFQKDHLKDAYKEADEAEEGEAVAEEKVIDLTQEQASVELAKKDIDDFYEEEEY